MGPWPSFGTDLSRCPTVALLSGGSQGITVPAQACPATGAKALLPPSLFVHRLDFVWLNRPALTLAAIEPVQVTPSATSERTSCSHTIVAAWKGWDASRGGEVWRPVVRAVAVASPHGSVPRVGAEVRFWTLPGPGTSATIVVAAGSLRSAAPGVWGQVSSRAARRNTGAREIHSCSALSPVFSMPLQVPSLDSTRTSGVFAPILRRN